MYPSHKGAEGQVEGGPHIPLYDKRLFWCVACLAFWGSLRVHEILAVQPHEFTPERTMVLDDIKLEQMDLEGKQVEVVRVKIRSPKEMKAQHSIQFVELVGTGGWMCPVNAVKALKQMRSEKE